MSRAVGSTELFADGASGRRASMQLWNWSDELAELAEAASWGQSTLGSPLALSLRTPLQVLSNFHADCADAVSIEAFF